MPAIILHNIIILCMCMTLEVTVYVPVTVCVCVCVCVCVFVCVCVCVFACIIMKVHMHVCLRLCMWSIIFCANYSDKTPSAQICRGIKLGSVLERSRAMECRCMCASIQLIQQFLLYSCHMLYQFCKCYCTCSCWLLPSACNLHCILFVR